MHCRNQVKGFSLIEALIALAIVTLIMTVGMALLAQQSGIGRRVAAHQEALRLIESTLEAVRADQLPLTSGRVELAATATESDVLTLWLEVAPSSRAPGLFEVQVEARYVVGVRTLRRSVRTMVWRSP